MKKSNLSALFILSLSFLTACSESAYTPVNGQLGYGTGLYNQTGFMGQQMMMNGMMMPGMMNPSLAWNQQFFAQNPYINGTFNQFSQAQLMMQSQAMFSLRFRMMTPNFFYPQYTYNNCSLRRQVTYTPAQCACVQAPCHCESVLSQIRQRCNNRTNTANTLDRNSNWPITPADSTAGVAQNSNNNSTSNSSTDPLVSDVSRPTTPSDNTVTSNSSQMMSLSILNEDAEALYKRLAKKEEEVGKKITVRRGQNYICIYDRNMKKGKRYQCDLDVNLENGSLFAISQPGVSANPEVYSGIYKGSSVEIGGPGRSPEEGAIVLGGLIAKRIYDRLPSIDGQTARKGSTLQCELVANTKNNAIVCTTRIKSDTGEALPVL